MAIENIHEENFQHFGLRYERVDMKFGNRKVKNIVTIPSMSALEKYMRFSEDKLNSHGSSTQADSGSWYGTYDLNEWYDVMKYGDDNVMEKIKKAKEKSMQQLGGYSPKGYTFDVEGEFFDIGEVLSNKPECWLNPIKDEEEKMMTIKISTSANNGVSAKEIVDGAGELLGMIGKLENDGYKVRVENWLYSQSVSKDDKEDLVTKIVVKDFNDFINFSKMSAIVSPSLQRRGSFMIKERLFERSLDSGYGQTQPLDGITTVYDKSAMRELKDKLFKKDN